MVFPRSKSVPLALLQHFIVDHSSFHCQSLNEGIPEVWCSLFYVSVQDTAQDLVTAHLYVLKVPTSYVPRWQVAVGNEMEASCNYQYSVSLQSLVGI